jgi:N utilization substance protein B
MVLGVKLTDFPEFNPEDIERTEEIEHPPAATQRSAARRMALQVLYEVDSTDHTFTQVIAERVQETPIPKRSERYLRQLVKGILDNKDRLDALIKEYASEWPLDQIAIVDRNILRLGFFELGAEPKVPVSVAIAEAMELADLFGADGSIRFVNGVLGAFVSATQEVVENILPPEPENGN